MARHEWKLIERSRALAPIEPDASQTAVIAHVAGPALVTGAAGSGRTTTIVEAALTRIREGADPSSVLVFASSRQAAASIRELCTLRSRGFDVPRVSTFHSFALDVVSRTEEMPLRLLSGAEQETAVRDIIDGTLHDPSLARTWPESLREALPTRGFAREVRAAFAAARSFGLSGDEVSRMGARAGDDAWAAIGPVLDEYLDSQSLVPALDYAELMFRAVAAAREPRNASLFSALRFLYVDDYEETDAMQAALLRELARYAEAIVVAGNPDVSVFGFRGARPANVREFPDHFSAMASVRVMPLQQIHRFSNAVRDVAVEVFARAEPLDVPESVRAVHRMPACSSAVTNASVNLFDDAYSEAAHIVSRVRALVPDTGDEWSDIAVLARSSGALAPLERALQRAGIPTSVDARTGRIAEHPAVRTLLLALDVAARGDRAIAPHVAHELLLSPLCDLDPGDVRALARRLRGDRRIPSDEALAEALGSSSPVLEVATAVSGAEEFEKLRALVERARQRVVAGATPHEVLWLLWDGTRWPQRLRRQAVEHAVASAHRDLDAVCELFDIADRAAQRRQGRAGVASFVADLTAQEVPAETLAERGFVGPAVELLTAHAAKGREWRHVFVVGVNEGMWPNLRRRGSVIDSDRLTPHGLEGARDWQSVLDEERRLFHLACTRASRSLTVSGIAGDRESAQPSRFLQGSVAPAVRMDGRPDTIDAPDQLVATLRRVATSEQSSPLLRSAAALRLRHLSSLTDDARDPLFPEANPDRWWGMREVTTNSTPLHDPNRPLYVRGSSLDSLTSCGLQWFLQQRAGADSARGTALVFGSALHALADAVARGGLPPEADVLTERLRSVWNDAGYDSDWQSARDFEAAVSAIGRFLHWHTARRPRVVASEVPFDGIVTVVTPSGRQEELRMRGTVDRVEISDADGVMVFDFKTGRSKPTQAAVDSSGQLRYYQLAHAHGLIKSTESVRDTAAGAALVHLRLDASSRETGSPLVQERASMPADEPWVSEVLGAALDTVRAEHFPATTGPHCRVCSLKVICPAQPEGRVDVE